jgi:hypothetical protein
MLAVASQFAEQHQMTKSGKPRRDRSPVAAMAFSLLLSRRARSVPTCSATLFRISRLMGARVGACRARAYSAGRCNHWIKVKKPKHPADRPVRDQPFKADASRVGGASAYD